MSSLSLSENDGYSEFADDELDVRLIYKVVFLGNSGVGKTNIMHRFTVNSFNINSKPTIGVDFAIKTIAVEDVYVKLQLWDTAGQERYQTYTSAYFKDALGLIVVYDVTNRESFKGVSRWIEIAKDHVSIDLAVLLLVGNKTDLEGQREVTTEEGREFAVKNGLLFMETSAFDSRNPNVFKAMKLLVKSQLIRHNAEEHKIEHGHVTQTATGHWPISKRRHSAQSSPQT